MPSGTLSETRTSEAVYIVEGDGAWALIDVVMETKGGRTALAGMHVTKVASDPRKAATFNLRDARPEGWAMLAAMSAAVGVTIAALVRIWRSGLFNRRWLWTIGALFRTQVDKRTPQWPSSAEASSVVALIALFRRARQASQGVSAEA